MTTLRLVLGDQLNPRHSWFETVDPDTVYVFMEVRQETDYVLHHAQKIIAIFAAMRDLAASLKAAGHRVHYDAIDDPDNLHDIPANLDRHQAHYQATRLEYQAPDEWRLDRQLADFARRSCEPCIMVDSEHFLTRRDTVSDIFKDRKSWLMEHFYRQMRARHDVLIERDGKPVGGRWNFDQENRKSWPGDPPEPADARTRHDHSALWQTIVDSGVNSFGTPQADHFSWPLNRDEALV